MPAEQKMLQCMEVWGGNQKTDSSIVLPGLDAWIYSEPWHQESAGGDVHYMSSCASGQVVRMLVADVAGHGESASETAQHLRKLMRRHVNDHSQKRFVRSLNREFTAASTDGIFATAVAMTFDSPTNRLLICNAGHPPPLWYRASTQRWVFLAAENTGSANFPWGIVDTVDYEQFAVELAVNDLVLCYTDSLIEARDDTGDLIGGPGLLQLVNDLGSPAPATLSRQIIAGIDSRGKDNLDRDDITLLLFRPNGKRPHVPLVDRLLAPARFMSAMLGKPLAWTGGSKLLHKH